MVEKIIIKLPADLLELTGLSSESLEEKSLLIWILEIYAEGKISLSKAANLLNMKVDEFLAEFYKRHLRHIGGPESIEEAEKDLDLVQKLINNK
jgi:predicted HTH domain antitoxin